jgi:phosphomannomutase
LRNSYPNYFISKNKIELTPQINVDEVLEKIKSKYADEKINTADGVKIDFEKEKEWVHLRKSNTEPIIRIYAESQNEKKANELAKRIIKDIHEVIQL